MKWKKFTLTTTTEAVDYLGSMFDEIGIQGINALQIHAAVGLEGQIGAVAVIIIQRNLHRPESLYAQSDGQAVGEGGLAGRRGTCQQYDGTVDQIILDSGGSLKDTADIGGIAFGDKRTGIGADGFVQFQQINRHREPPL